MSQISQPRTFADALALRAAHPGMVVIAGGTGVMVERNGTPADAPLLDLSRVDAFAAVDRDGPMLRLGAGVTYTQAVEALAGPLPGLAAAARTVASRQIRNRATVAGALVLADPSADALAALAVSDAEVELSRTAGVRRVAASAFVRGPGKADLAPDELVTALLVPVADGPVAYAKVGARNAMARAVCGVAVALHPARRTVRVAVVGAAPTAVRPHAAELDAAAAADWDGCSPPEADALRVFGSLVFEALGEAHSDARGSAAYRRRAASALARRALARAWGELAAEAAA